MNPMLTLMRIIASALFAVCVGIAVQAQVTSQPPTFKFPETDSEYTVSFPSKPTVQRIYTGETEGLQAELILAKEGGILRAEFVQLSAEQARSLLKLAGEAQRALNENRIKMALEYAKSIGLSRAAAELEDDNRGWCVVVRGYKEIDGIPVTYETKFYYGKRSVMSLTTASSSRRFPTPSISKFYESLKLRQ
jgi:hypothetical protein